MARLFADLWIPAFAGMGERAANGGAWERGRLARNALARVTLILAFSHKGRRDLSLAIHA